MSTPNPLNREAVDDANVPELSARRIWTTPTIVSEDFAVTQYGEGERGDGGYGHFS